jgi:IS4 transposase
MVLDKVFEPFVEKSPICVMVRGVLERCFSADNVNSIFEATAEKQYTRELLFSTLVRLMAEVVFKIAPSMRAAYQGSDEEIPVSITSVYNKLNGVETKVSAELVRSSARQLASLIRGMKGAAAPLVPGYSLKYLDGNHLAGTEHRILELRTERAAALPGHSLVILDQELMLATEVILCEDGHAQERSLLEQVLRTLKRKDLIVADRNFCTTGFLFGIARRKGFFIIRQHAANLTWRLVGHRRRVGKVATGVVYEQAVVLTNPETGKELTARRVTVALSQATRDGDQEIHVLTNLPPSVDALRVAEVYRTRWTEETMFQELTQTLECEIDTLGYPKAALFGFCLALMAYNAVSVIKASLRAVHGEQTVREKLSMYYMTLEVQQVYTGMMIAIPPAHWTIFATLSEEEMAETLLELAGRARMSKYAKHPRGPKKPPPQKNSGAVIKHLSTARLIAKRRAETLP